jgi:hypothetical protein
MIIKAMYTKTTIQSKGYNSTFVSPKYKLEYIQSMDSYLIDNTTIVPSSNISEVVVEQESIKPMLVTNKELEELPNEELVDTPKKLKKSK